MKITHYFITIFIMINFLGCMPKESTNEQTPLSVSNQKLSEILKNKIVDTGLIDSVLYQAFNVAQTYSSKTHDSLIAATCRQIGNLFLERQQYDTACQYYKRGLDYGKRHLIASDEIIARLHHNTGLTYFYLDDFKSAVKYFDLIQVESLEKPLLTLKANKLQRLATCYYYLKDYKSAERLFQKAIPMAQLYLTNQNQAYVYTNYANCLRVLNQYQASIDASQKAINILEALSKTSKLPKSDSISLAGGYFGIAHALQDSGVYLSAEKYYNQALLIFKQINDIDNHSMGLLNMGLMFRYSNDLEKSKKTLTDGIELLDNQKILSDYLWVLKGKFYINRSEVFFEKKQYQKALTDQDSAISYLTKYDKSPSLNTLLLSSRYSLLSVYSDRAKINMLLAENGQNTEGYQKALTFFHKIIELADDIRADYFSDEAKLTLATDAKPALEKAIDVCHKLYIKTKDKQYLDQAFGFIEYSRSMVLYENARLENQLPPELRAENERLKELERDLIKNNNIEKLQEYLRLKRQFREKIKSLNRNQLATVSDLQSALIKADTTAFIEYFVGDSAIFVFSLIKNDKQLIKLNKPKDLDKQIENLRYEITSRQDEPIITNSTVFEQASKDIYTLLLHPTLKQLPTTINQLIIAPDGVLNYLPFDVLIKDDNNDNNSKELSNNKIGNSNTQLAANKSSKDSSFITNCEASKQHHSSFLACKFLLQDYTISYAYSANLLLKQKRPKSKEELAPKLFAGFASRYEESDSIRRAEHSSITRGSAFDLPFAKDEVEDISSIMGFWLGKTFTGKNATEAVFKTEASRYRILHFAMHSWADDKDPAFSRLLFTLTPKDSTDDNNLTAAELYTMNLKADLAVLSACNTGFGTINKGEGVMSLARAFAFAHVPATVTSLWKVDDKATCKLMVNFYTNLKQGMTKDAALRQAKITYLEGITQSVGANPYYWAGFVPTGNMDAMDLDVEYPLSMWGILAGLLAASGLGFWYWKRR